ERPEEVDYSLWHEGTEWLGEKNVEELSQMIGLPSASMPGLNTTEPASPVDSWTAEGIAAMAAPDAVPLALFLHQWQGIVKMVYNMMSYKNTLLMDGVGIGKTAQAICSILMYDYIARVQAEGVVPPVFGQSPTLVDPADKLRSTLFDPARSYGVVIVDEVHAFRKKNPRRLVISALIAKGRYTIGITATP
ncbi:hypothetical protein K466DRAFT_474387, partial [Polyporus arcularius HHB13444]